MVRFGALRALAAVLNGKKQPIPFLFVKALPSSYFFENHPRQYVWTSSDVGEFVEYSYVLRDTCIETLNQLEYEISLTKQSPVDTIVPFDKKIPIIISLEKLAAIEHLIPTKTKY